jgi:transcriptional antiterminator RfaH
MNNSSQNAQWYLLQSKPRQEFKSAQELENQGYEIFLPVIETQKIRANKLQSMIEPLFSRYLFIRLNKTTDNWAPIRYTKGISAIVRFGGQPAKVSGALIEQLRHSLLDIPTQEIFYAGDAIEVSAGPFQTLTGIFQNLKTIADGEVRAMVLIDLLGKQQLLEFQLFDLRIAT